MSDVMHADETAGAPGRDGAAAGRIVVFSSPDVLATLGRPGLLEGRAAGRTVLREPALRSDTLLQRLTAPLPDVGGPLEEWIGASGTAAAGDDVGLVVLSIHPDLFGAPPWRHRSSGLLIEPPPDHETTWGGEALAWLREQCEPQPPLDPAASAANLDAIADALAAEHRSLVVFNVSTFDPADTVHRYTGQPDTYAVRANRLIAGIEHVAARVGALVVDVDGAVAELGAIEHVPRAGALSVAAADFVTEEAIHLVDGSGALGASIQPPVMRLEMTPFDRRSAEGTVVAWHVSPGQRVSDGDPLCEIRYEGLLYRVDRVEQAMSRRKRRDFEKNRTVTMLLVAGGDAVVHLMLAAEGDRLPVGSPIAVMTSGEPADEVGLDDAEGPFRVGMKYVEREM